MPKANDATCPSCHSSDLYKFGFDEYDNQKHRHLIIGASFSCYHLHASTRKVSQLLKTFSNVEVSHVAIASWTKRLQTL